MKVCPNCQATVDEDAVFCAKCGTQIEVTSAEPTESPVSVEESAVLAGETATSAETAVALETEAPVVDWVEIPPVAVDMPKKKFPIKGLAITLVALAAVVALVLNMGSVVSGVKGFAIKNFGSDADYLQFAETEALTAYASALVDAYESAVLDAIDFSRSSETELQFIVSEDAEKMVEALLDADLDIQFVNDITLALETTVREDIQQSVMSLSISDTTLLDIDTIINLGENELFIALGELTDSVLHLDMTDMYGVSADEMNTVTASVLSDLKEKALPSALELDMLASKYIKMVLAHITEVQKETVTVEVDGISQKLTAMTYTVDVELLRDICVEVLTEAKSDQTIKDCIVETQKVLEKHDLYEVQEDAYKAFTTAIDEALEEIQDTPEEQFEEEVFTLTDYVNSAHEIVGRKLTGPETDTMEYVTVRDGKTFAFEMKNDDETVLIGKGTQKGSVLNGTYTVMAEDEKMVSVVLSDCDIARLQTGGLKGEITIVPEDALLQDWGITEDNAADLALSLFDPSLKLRFDNTKNTQDVTIVLMNGDEEFFGFSVSNEIGISDRVQVPQENVVDITDSEDLMEVVSGMDFDALIDKLEDTSVPEEYVTVLESWLSGLKQMADASADMYGDMSSDVVIA